jgi:hypothetical protein
VKTIEKYWSLVFLVKFNPVHVFNLEFNEMIKQANKARGIKMPFLRQIMAPRQQKIISKSVSQ